MQSPKWPLYASVLLTTGGLAWVVKIAIIVATNGRVMTTGPAAFLMSAGLVLLPLGAAGVGAWLARRSPVILRALAAVAAIAALIACTVALGWIGATLFRDRGPSYAAEEAGILAAGLLWSLLGATALVRVRRAGTIGGASA
jgi:hypothetical protein